MTNHPAGRPLPRILHGSAEPVFGVLPETVLDNLRRPGSENALLWNLIYPLAAPSLSLEALLAVRPLWGTAGVKPEQDDLAPFFWGYSPDGRRLPALDAVLDRIDGPGPRTEIDLFLLGRRNLVVVEAKRASGLGRCARFDRGRCPHAHPAPTDDQACRYWADEPARFDTPLAWDGPPAPDERPACSRHYQLARTLVVGLALASELDRQLNLWLLAPAGGWRRLEPAWLDFANAVRDANLWRRMRVIAWESLGQMPAGVGPKSGQHG